MLTLYCAGFQERNQENPSRPGWKSPSLSFCLRVDVRVCVCMRMRRGLPCCLSILAFCFFNASDEMSVWREETVVALTRDVEFSCCMFGRMILGSKGEHFSLRLPVTPGDVYCAPSMMKDIMSRFAFGSRESRGPPIGVCRCFRRNRRFPKRTVGLSTRMLDRFLLGWGLQL